MSFKLLVAAAAVVTATTACNSLGPSGSPDPGFGEAVKYDMAIQVINPDPVYGDKGAKPGASGAKAAEAAKRYRTDRVKDVSIMSTTTGSGPR